MNLSVERVRQASLIAGGLGVALVAGVITPHLTAHYGPTKVVWVFAAAIAAGAAMASLRIGMVALVLGLSMPFRSKVLVGHEIHTIHLLVLAVSIPVLTSIRFGRLRAARGIVPPLTLIFAGGLIASLAGGDTGTAVFRLLTGVLPGLAVVVIVSAAVRDAGDLKVLVLAFAFSLFVNDAITALQAGGSSPLGLQPFEPGRVNGFFFHPNILGGYIAALVLLLLGVAVLAWKELPLAPLTFGVPIGFGVVALAFTESRGALIGLAVGLVVLLVLVVLRRGVMPVLTLLLAVSVVLIIAIPQVPESRQRAFVQRFQALTQPGSEQGRVSIYKSAEREIGRHPFTGVGPLAFGDIERRRADFPGLPAGLLHAHNLWLETFLSVGPLGVLGLLWLLAGALYLGGRVALGRNRTRGDPISAGWAAGAVAGLTALIVQGMVDFIFWQQELLTLLMLLIAVCWSFGAGSNIRPLQVRTRETGATQAE